MKRFDIALVAVCLATSVASCNKELTPGLVSGESFRASVIAPETEITTKTYIEKVDDQYVPGWNNGDKINAFFGDITTSSTPSELSNSNATGKYANFSGSVSGPASGTVYAIYPSSCYKASNNGSIQATIKSYQTPTKTSFDPAADILVAVPSSYTVTSGTASVTAEFKHVLSLVKVNLKGTLTSGRKVQSITFTAPSGLCLSGTVNMNICQASPACGSSVAKDNQVTAHYSAGNEPVVGTDAVFLYTYPSTIASGSKIVISGQTDKGHFYKEITLSKTLTLKAGELIVLNVDIPDATYNKKTFDLKFTSAGAASNAVDGVGDTNRGGTEIWSAESMTFNGVSRMVGKAAGGSGFGSNGGIVKCIPANTADLDAIHSNKAFTIETYASFNMNGASSLADHANVISYLCNYVAKSDGSALPAKGENVFLGVMTVDAKKVFMFGLQKSYTDDNTTVKFANSVLASGKGSTEWNSSVPAEPNEDQMYHVVAVYDNGSMKLYVDGVLAGTLSTSLSATDILHYTNNNYSGQRDPWCIGGFFVPGDYIKRSGWRGKIAKVCVYTSALTDSEIAGLYSEISGEKPVIPSISMTQNTSLSSYASLVFNCTSNVTLGSNYGICWSTTANPTVSGAKMIGPDVTGSAKSVSQIIPAHYLNAGTEYYFRAYIKSGLGYAYSDNIKVQLPAQPSNPGLSWNDITPGSFPAGVKAYETTSNLNGTACHGYYVVAEKTAAKFKVNYNDDKNNPNAAQKTVSSQYSDDSTKPYVLINGGFFDSNVHTLGRLFSNGGVMTGGLYTATASDSKSYNVTRAMIGAGSDGTQYSYWNYGTGYYAGPMPQQIGSAYYSAPTTNNYRASYNNTGTNYSNAISNQCMLVHNGNVLIEYEKKNGSHYINNFEMITNDLYYGDRARSAIGYTSDGKWIFLMLDNTNGGACLKDMARIMKELGAVSAMNLDGGGSSCICIGGTTYLGEGTERSLPNNIGLYPNS